MARPKPAIASWIVRERKRLGMKPGDVVARLAAQGITVSEQTVRVWESNAGRNPSADNIDALERIFGTQAPDRAQEPGDMAAVVAAIDRQTAVISQLLEVLTQLAIPDPAAIAAVRDFALHSEPLRRLGNHSGPGSEQSSPDDHPTTPSAAGRPDTSRP